VVAMREAHRSEGGAEVSAVARGSPLVGHAREQMGRALRRSVRMGGASGRPLHIIIASGNKAKHG
jgi:hypothetical protein